MLPSSTALWPCSRVDKAAVGKVTVCRNWASLTTDTGKRWNNRGTRKNRLIVNAALRSPFLSVLTPVDEGNGKVCRC